MKKYDDGGFRRLAKLNILKIINSDPREAIIFPLESQGLKGNKTVSKRGPKTFGGFCLHTLFSVTVGRRLVRVGP